MRLLSVETRNHWRTDSGLEEVDDHEGECVGGEGLEPGLVDLVLLGPVLDRQHQGADPGVQLGVAVEEVRVARGHGVVHAQVHLQPPRVEREDGHLGSDQLDPAADEMTTLLLEQGPGLGEPLLVRDAGTGGEQAQVEVAPRPPEPVEGGAGDEEAAVHLRVELLVQTLPQVDLLLEQPPLLLVALEVGGDIPVQLLPLPGARGHAAQVEAGRAQPPYRKAVNEISRKFYKI